MTHLPLHLASIIATLCGCMFWRRGHSQHGTLLFHLEAYLARLAARFERLHARWVAGTLPRPRAPRPSAPARAPRTPSTRLRIPRAHAFISRLVPDGFAIACQLEAMLARPDCAEFLAAVPRAGRILRPLCRLIGTPLPPALARPPRPRRPRPRPEPPPQPPELHGKYSPRQIRRYRPGRIPDPSRKTA
jgi:hypothetical protein